jgi:hypothetical protein
MAAAPQAAIVHYANDRITSIYLTDIHETGDWTTFDKYSFDKNEMLTGMERTIDMAFGQREEQSWTITGKAAVKQKSIRRNDKTNEVVPGDDIWFPDPLVVTRKETFPFWRLISDKRQEIITRGRTCSDEKR